MTRTLDGAFRNNFKSAPCSAGRSFPASVSVLPAACTFTWPLNLLSEMAASIRPLYSAALGLSEFSAFLGATFSTAISAGLGSAGFVAAPAPAAGSVGCGEAAVPAALAVELSEVVSDVAGGGAAG